MKTIGIIGITLAIIGLGIGAYCQIEIVPMYDFLDSKSDLAPFDRALWHSYGEQKFMLGNVAMLAGIIAIITGIITAIKKMSLGWIAAFVGIVSLLLGASQATHMFS